jgi:diguanylate cyclase (GGDEF)-like protein
LRKRVEQQTRIIRESEKSFRYMAEHDGLTGLLNRVEILSILEREIERARQRKTGVTIVLCDIDHFKRVNDTRGHLAGDAALRRFATVLAASVRTDDFVGRYGGEEFLLVLTGIFAYQVEERLAVLHSRISNLTVFDQQTEFQITCSLGATFIPGGQCAVEGQLALGATDHALYQAKEAGRNRVVFQPLIREIA